VRLLLRSVLAVWAVCVLLPGHGSAYFLQLSNNALDPQESPEQFRPAEDGSRPGPHNHPLPVKIEVLPFPPEMPPGTTEAVERAVKSWDRVPGSAMEVSTNSPNGTYDYSFETRRSEADGRNTIEFIPYDWPDFWGSNVICRTVPKLDDDGRITEADIFCNAEHYRWTIFPYHGVFPDLASKDRVDVQALITHEMGHVLGLGHSQFAYASMYWLPGMADTRCRRLTSDDKAGMRSLYPRSEEDVPPPSIWGVHRDDFAGARCGIDSYIKTRVSALHYYRENNGGRIELSIPHATGDDLVEYCLFGSGFSGSTLLGMDVLDNGVALDAATLSEYVSPNFVKAKILNGAGGSPSLPAGAYDLSAENRGGPGSLFQGLIVNQSGNLLPEAVVLAGRTLCEPGSRVKLSGAGSFDPEGGPVTFEWSVAEAPGDTDLLSSYTAKEVQARLPEAGLYVFRLVTNDGTADSIADQVIVRAEYGADPPDDDDDYSPLGCASQGAGESGTGAAFLLPALVTLFLLLVNRAIFRRRHRAFRD